ncbi:MAG: mRNA interferase MazF [Candidatus Latescibacterota bacterium]|jgi:mRNA interferase MazF
MKESDVVLTPIPQADGQIKHRPAVVLREMPGYGDLLVCGVSTQLQHCIENFDEIIASDASDYASSGLVSTSLIRLSFLSVLPKRTIAGVIGEISSERHTRLLNALSSYLTEKSTD